MPSISLSISSPATTARSDPTADIFSATVSTPKTLRFCGLRREVLGIQGIEPFEFGSNFRAVEATELEETIGVVVGQGKPFEGV
ncbi:hypothetical protein L1049_020507 [Liquidambar formosana]|uniref:Uncharacterized protein n=1 Tax=Liquidambar formosana TaxID=63359 RepID=A0AAP0S796_LIQFO